jgi:16S rRNA (guanine527-N7)-methyltransferase
VSTLPRPVGDRLAELAAEFAVAPPGAAALAVLLERLARDDAAPTTVRDPARAVELHVADALAGLRVPELEGAETMADLGAGAGVPSLVLAAARPAMRVIAVEATGRKCAFIESLGAAMGLANLAVVARRAEEWQAGRGACDAVTARALAPLPVLAEYAAPLLRPGGALVAWKGEPDPVEERDGDAAAALLGLAPARRVSVAALPGAERRSLYVYVRTGSVPSGYPRRPGMARKRPIRAPEDAGK